MDRPVIGLSMNYMQLGQYHQFHIRDKYIDAVRAAGAMPLVIPCTSDAAEIRQYLALTGALIIIGGLDYPPDLYGQEPHPLADLAHPRRAESDLLLLKLAIEMKLPILGICAGMQLINIYFGGSLIQHIDQLDNHLGEKYHEIEILGGRFLAQIYQDKAVTVNSNHHQAVDPKALGKGLRIVAMAEDGIIEAVEADCPQMLLGIQWHPERIADPKIGLRVFDYMAELAGRGK